MDFDKCKSLVIPVGYEDKLTDHMMAFAKVVEKTDVCLVKRRTNDDVYCYNINNGDFTNHIGYNFFVDYKENLHEK